MALYNSNTKRRVNIPNLQDEIFIGVSVPFQTFENHKNKQKQKQMQQSQMTNGYMVTQVNPYSIQSTIGIPQVNPYGIPQNYMQMPYQNSNIQMIRNPQMSMMQKPQGLPSPIPNQQALLKQFNQPKQNLPKK